MLIGHLLSTVYTSDTIADHRNTKRRRRKRKKKKEERRRRKKEGEAEGVRGS